MSILTTFKAFEDGRGNRILYDGLMEKNIKVHFRGSNNTLVLREKTSLHALHASFDCDNGTIEIGSHHGVTPLKA